MRLLVLGHARHGKDTLCEMIREFYGYNFVSSSYFCAQQVVFPALKDKYGYANVDDCYADRANHRSEWFDIIAAYNTPDPSKLGVDLFKQYDIYCGLRNAVEFMALNEVRAFDLCLWVDASKRMPPEDLSSCTVVQGMADMTVNNNGTIEELREIVKTMDFLRNKISRMKIGPTDEDGNVFTISGR